MLRVGDGRPGHVYADVVEIHRRRRTDEDRGVLVERGQSQMLEHRHQLGDRGRSVAQEHAEPPLVVDGVERTTERGGDVVGPRQHRFDVDEVADGRFGSHTRLVIGWHRVGDHGPHTMTLDLAEQVDERIPGTLTPGPRGTVDRRHESGVVVERCGPNGHRDTRERTGPQQRLEVADLTAVVLRHQSRDEFREGRRESGPRHVREHGDPGPDRLGEVEDPDDVSLLQSGDRRDQFGQLPDAGFEDDVTRQGLDHVADGPARVALDGRADRVDHLVGALSDAGNREHALAVGGAAEQAGEPHLLAARRDADRDRRHACPAVHRGHRIGSGDHDGLVTGVWRRVDALGIETTRAVLTEQARRIEPQPIAGHLVDRRAEEDEVGVGQPPHERVVTRHLQHALLHRSEITHDGLDVVDRRADIGFESFPRLRRTPVELDQRPGLDTTVGGVDVDQLVTIVSFDAQHRMDHEVDVELVAVEHHAHAVDQELHVVGDEHQDRVFRLPTVALQVRRQHLDQGFADASLASQLQKGDRRGIHGVEPTPVGVIARNVAVVQAEERLQQPVRRTAFSSDLPQAADDGCHVIVSAHECPRWVVSLRPT